jgi:hypothetical protein
MGTNPVLPTRQAPQKQVKIAIYTALGMIVFVTVKPL